MSLALILATSIAAAPPVEAPEQRAGPPVDRSLSDTDRLRELGIEVAAAYGQGRIDRATAARFHYEIERIRRQIVRMGIQVGYRQRLRVRARIERLHAGWAEQAAMSAAVRSGN